LAAITTFALALVFGRVKLTGLGLSMMLIILGEQYSNHIVRELAENEAALAKSRMQLLANQISPHYIYITLCKASKGSATAILKRRGRL
jgi:hypothetical protein